MASLAINQSEAALVRLWLTRCIRRFEAMPPTPTRNSGLRVLQEQLDSLPTSNVIPMRRAG